MKGVTAGPLILGALLAASGASYNLGHRNGREAALEDCRRVWTPAELEQRISGLELRARNLGRRVEGWRGLKRFTEERRKRQFTVAAKGARP